MSTKYEKAKEKTRLAMAALTPRQQAYARERIKEPLASTSKLMLKAGYHNVTKSTIRNGLKSGKVIKAIDAQIEEQELRAKTAEELEDFKKDPEGNIKRRLNEHAQDQRKTPNQTAALVWLGKTQGMFIEKSVVVVGVIPEVELARKLLAPPPAPIEIAQPSEE